MSGEEENPMDQELPSFVFENRWIIISPNVFDSFVVAETESEMWSIVTNASTLESGGVNLRSNVILEFIFHNLVFYREKSFSFSQAVGLLSIVMSIFEHFFFNDTEDTKENAVAVFSLKLQDLIHGKRQGEGGSDGDGENPAQTEGDSHIEIPAESDTPTPILLIPTENNNSFSTEDVKQIINFFTLFFLRNFESYRYCMTEMNSQKLIKKTIPVQTPLTIFPSLSDGEFLPFVPVEGGGGGGEGEEAPRAAGNSEDNEAAVSDE